MKEEIKGLKDKYLHLWSIELLFLLIAILYFFAWYLLRGIPLNDDIFNYLRLKDIGLSIIHGYIPQFNLYTGHPLGLATNVFYPYLLLLPFTFLFILFKGTTAFAITYFFIIFIGLNILFFSSLHFQHNKVFSFLNSIFYFTSTIIFIQTMQNGDVGYLLASCVLPLVMYGWLYWIKESKWRMLCIGMILTLYSNIPAFIIVSSIILILTILSYRQINKRKILNVIKAIVVFTLCSCAFVVPLAILEGTNNIFTPNMVGIHLLDTTHPVFVKPIMYWFSPVGYTVWDLVDLLAFIFCIRYYHKLNKINKQMLFIGIIIVICCCEPIQSFLLNHTFLYSLQFLTRFCMISHFIFSVLLAKILCFYASKKIKKQSHYLSLIDILVVWLILCLSFGTISHLLGSKLEKSYYPYTKIARYDNLNSFYPHLQTNKSSKIFLNKYDESSSLLHEALPNNYSDYAPIKTVFVFGHAPIYSSMMHTLYYPKTNAKNYSNNGINLYEKQSQNKKIPLLIFHQQRYNITDNGKTKSYKNTNGYAKIHLHKGKNHIRITTPSSMYKIISIIVSMVGFIILIFFKRTKNKVKNNA